jgi:hypothetical protein
MNKRYYDEDYVEIEKKENKEEKKEKELENKAIDDLKNDSKLQKNMFKVIIIVAVFLISLGITTLSRINSKNIEGIVSTETNELRDTLTSEMSKNTELIEKMERKQKELETLKNNASRKK